MIRNAERDSSRMFVEGPSPAKAIYCCLVRNFVKSKVTCQLNMSVDVSIQSQPSLDKTHFFIVTVTANSFFIPVYGIRLIKRLCEILVINTKYTIEAFFLL